VTTLRIASCLLAATWFLGLAWAQPHAIAPVGLVMSSGATLVRAGQSVSAKPGEVLFTGDSLRAGTLSATFLFCPQKLSTTIAPGSEALLAADSFHVRTGSVQDRKPVSACFLPAVQKLSVASMQHYGVMIARSGSAPPPKTSLDERIAALPEAARQELNGELATWNAALAEDPKDLAALIARAAALDRAGLSYDAGEAYRKVTTASPDLAWARIRVTEIERALERDQMKKE
jgi:hypothetical protein